MSKVKYLLYAVAVAVLTALAVFLFALWHQNPDLIWIPADLGPMVA